MVYISMLNEAEIISSEKYVCIIWRTFQVLSTLKYRGPPLQSRLQVLVKQVVLRPLFDCIGGLVQ